MVNSRQRFDFGNSYTILNGLYGAAGERMAIYKPRRWVGDGTVPAVIYCPALGGGCANVQGWFCAPDIAKRGFPVICGDIGGTPTTWDQTDAVPPFGSDASLTKLTDLIEWVTTARTVNTSKGFKGFGAYPNKVILHGGSMGGQTATLYAHDFPAKIDSVFTDIAAFNPEYCRAAKLATASYPAPNGLDPPITAALGSPVPAAKEGYKCGPTWPLAVPYWGWYEGSDYFTPESAYNSFKADMIARGATFSFIKTGDHGHTTAYCPWTTIADLTEQRAVALMG